MIDGGDKTCQHSSGLVDELSFISQSGRRLYCSADLQASDVNIRLATPLGFQATEIRSVEEAASSSEKSRDGARSDGPRRLVSPMPSSPLRDRSILRVSTGPLNKSADRSSRLRALGTTCTDARPISSPNRLEKVARRYLSPPQCVQSPLVERKIYTPVRYRSASRNLRIVSPINTARVRMGSVRPARSARMSPMLLRVSPCRDDDDSDSSVDYIDIVQPLRGCRANKGAEVTYGFPTLTNISSLLLKFDEVWTTSEDEKENSGSSSREGTMKLAGHRGGRPLTSTAEVKAEERLTLGRTNCCTGPLIEILQSVKYEKDLLVLIESEVCARRRVTKAYVSSLREILLWCALEHATIVAQAKKVIRICKLPNQARQKGRSNSVPNVPTSHEGVGGRPPWHKLSPQQANQDGDPQPLVSTQPPHRSKSAGQRGTGVGRSNIRYHQQGGGPPLSLCREGEEGTTPPNNSCTVPGTQSRLTLSLSSSITTNDVPCRTSQEMLETKLQLRIFLSDEVGRRLLLREAEEAGFKFIYHYYRIEQAAIRRDPIYLQEACQRKSIVSEARNQFSMINNRGKSMGLLEHINWVENWAQRFLSLIESERYVRVAELQHAEECDRKEIQQRFQKDTMLLSRPGDCGAVRQRNKTGVSGIILKEKQAGQRPPSHEPHSFLRMTSVSKEQSGGLNDVRYSNRSALLETETQHKHSEQYSFSLPFDTDSSSSGNNHSRTAEPLGSYLSTAQGGVNLSLAVSAAMRSGTLTNALPSESDAGSEIIFFEWDPTSNTLTRTSNNNFTSVNTSSNTTTGTVVAATNTSIAVIKRERAQARSSNVIAANQVSSPSPKAPTCEITQISESNSNRSGNLVAVIPANSGNIEKPYVQEVDEVANASEQDTYRFSLLSEKSVLSKSSRAASPPLSLQEDKKINQSYFEPTKSPTETQKDGGALLANRHIVPCSLKAAISITEASSSSSKQFFCEPFSDLRLSATRPYDDSVIYNNSSKGYSEIDFHELSSAEVEEVNLAEEGIEKPDGKGLVVSNRTASSLTISLDSDSDDSDDNNSSNNNNNKRGDQSGSPANGPYGNGDLIDSTSTEYVFESVHDDDDDDDDDDADALSLQSVKDVRKGENATQSDGPQPQKSNDTSSKSTEVSSRTGNNVPMSCPEAQGRSSRELLALEEVSVSTMNEETAGSMRSESGARNALRRRERRSSSPVQGESTVGETTTQNEEAARSKKQSAQGGTIRRHRKGSATKPIEPPNYMQPTTGWARQSEEKMWQRLFSRRGGSSRERSDVRSSSLNSEGARRTKVRRVFKVGSRLPYEDGPGVWGCTCEPRQPYSPKKEIKETPESCCSGRNTAAGYVKQGPEDALVVSPTRRRDAAIWFKSHGTLPQRKSIQRGASPRGKRTKGGGDASLPEGLVPSAVLDALKGIIRRGTPTARSGSRTRGSDAGTPQKKRNLSSSRKNACGGTPTYVEAFYKLDPQVAKRYGLIIASHEGPVLRNITPRTRGKCTAKTRGLPPRSTGDNFSCVRELSPISIPKERSNTPVRASFTVPHVLSTPGSKHHREK